VKKVTIAVIVGTILAVSAYDVIPAANQKSGDTISEVLLKAARFAPVVAVAWGILTGHLFWPQGGSHEK